MKWDAMRGCLVAGVAAVAMAEAADAHAGTSGTVTLASDYVWRGSSQTSEDPAVQAGVRAGHDMGLYANLWGSNVAFDPDLGARSEFDVMVGWTRALSDDWSVDAGVIRYLYPGTGRQLDWTEVSVTATLREHAWLQVAHSRDALAGGHPGTYAQLGGRLALSDTTRLEAAYGRYGLSRAQGRDYQHAQFSVIHAISPAWEVRLTGHATDRAARSLFPGNAGTRMEFALQASF